MMPGITSAMAAINRHLRQLEGAAGRIARQEPHPDLAHEMVHLLLSSHGVKVNMKVMKTADQLVGTIFDEFA